jgi:hypothetical protein
MARKLRIAVSVFFGLLTVALAVLWVRSFYWHDRVRAPSFNSGGISVASMTGQIRIVRNVSLWNWSFETNLIPDGYAAKPWRQRWGFGSNARSSVVVFPHESLIVVFALLTALPWASPTNRFSLRTLLIATTLVAAVLGLGVWLIR